MSPGPLNPMPTEALAMGLMRWLLVARTPLAPREYGTGMHLLRYPWQFRLVSLGGALLVAGFLAVGYLGMQQADVGGAVYWVLAVAVGGGMAWHLYDVFGRTIGCSDEELMVRELFGRERRHRWAAVTAITYGTFTGLFTIRLQDGPRVRVSVYRSGLRTLCQVADRHLQYSPTLKVPFVLYEKAKNPT